MAHALAPEKRFWARPQNSRESMMRKLMLASVATAALAMTMNVATPAHAAGLRPATPLIATQVDSGNLVTKVRWNGHHRHHSHNRHWRGRHYYYGRDDWGPALGLGLGAGLLLGGLAANAQAQSAIAWCDRHYRSYDPRTQTYLGYDGYRHSCP